VDKIGLQLYSIQELTQKDFLGTLRSVGEIGYDGVEFAGYFNTPAKVLKKALEEYGLLPAGSHVGIEQLQDRLDKEIDYSLQIGNNIIICPYLPEPMRDSADAYKRTGDLFNTIGDRCRKQGILFGYHNHEFEFEKFDGEYGLDLLVKNTEPGLVDIQLDTFWAEYCGLKSVDFMRKYKERCSLLHIKDMKSNEEKVNTEIGKGIMDFKEIVDLGKELKVKWFTVEQEEFEIPLLESIKVSLKYLRKII
jgi:sugar phosphate isomerase/epimerase